MSAPTPASVLGELRALGSEQTLKIYRRHGLAGEAFGVKYGDLDKLARRLRGMPGLAEGLWDSGNHDARVLALKIADPATFTATKLDRWCGRVNRIQVSDLVRLACRTPHACALAEKWSATGPANGELKQVAGWFTVAFLATNDPALPRAWFQPWLRRIGREIGDAPNFVKYALNEALIAIGGRDDVKLRDEALKIAADIGKVEVDHGETGCRTPDAASYIAKIWDRREAKARR